MSITQAAISGAKMRLRPILMTSFAFIFGLLPLMLTTGAGANGNHSIGTSAVGGMLIGTLFGVFIAPVLFVIFQNLQERIRKNKHYDDDEDDDDDDNDKVARVQQPASTNLSHNKGNPLGWQPL
jgi:HAE1 family hydrophobic/amphiphilic exporter-1